MSVYKWLKNNFTSGRLSKLLGIRSDFDRYQNGAEEIQNMITLPQGGLTVRPGTIFQAEVKDSSSVTRLIPFQFSTTDSYMLEFGDQYFRVYKNSGLVLESDVTITGITQANPAVVTTSGAHGYSNGDQVYITGVVGMTEINDSRLYYTVANVTATTFEVQDRDGSNVDSSSFTAYSSGGTVNKIYTVTTPYVAADLFNLDFAQTADVITIVGSSYSPRDITRTSDTAWSVTPWMKDSDDASATLQIVDGPYLAENESTTTITASGGSYSPGDTVTLTASSIVGINSNEGFKTTDVGRLIRLWNSTDAVWGWAEITAWTSTTVIDVVVKGENDIAGTPVAETLWRLGAWSETTGFPKTITYYQQRRFLANTDTEIDKLWGSAIEGFYTFEPGTNDVDAVSYLIASAQVNAIYWLTGSGKRLRIGTEGGVWSVWGGSDNLTITPTNVEANFERPTRCKKLKPIDLGSETLFIQRSGKVMRELSFVFEKDSLFDPDISILSEDILGDKGDTTDEGVVDMCYQLEPISSIWAAKDDGETAGLTYAKTEQILAWHNHIFGGTDTKVKSIKAITSEGQDIVWMIVERTIDSVTRKYVEKFDVEYRNRDVQDAIFFDSATEHTGDVIAQTLTLSAITGTGITATAGGSVFVAGDVGRVIEQIQTDGTRSKFEITGYTSGTIVTGNVLRDFVSTSISASDWNMSVNTIDGLDAWEGETLSILANGGTHPERTVSSGSITLDAQYNKLVIGFPYTSKVTTMNIDIGSQLGTSFTGKQAIEKIQIDYYQSVGGKLYQTEGEETDLVYRKGNSLMGEGISAETDYKEIRVKSKQSDRLQLTFEATPGLPFTLLGFTIRGQLKE